MRSPGWTAISLPLHERLVEKLDSVRGDTPRALFIRRAIKNELIRLGVIVTSDLIDSPTRAGKGGTPTHKKRIPNPNAAEEEKSYDPTYFRWPFKGSVAAGLPGNFDCDSNDTVQAAIEAKRDHYAVRINGRSMEPTFQDGDLVEVRLMKDGEFPKKQKVYVWWLESEGFVCKRLIYTKDGKKNPDGTPRKPTPHLASDNPEFPEVCPIGEARAVGEVLGLIK